MPLLRRTFGFTEATSHLVPWEEIHEGCSRRDCIPALDEPRFVSADKARFLGAGDAVLALTRGGEAKAYPLKILNWHELVNDTVGGEPVLISYCRFAAPASPSSGASRGKRRSSASRASSTRAT